MPIGTVTFYLAGTVLGSGSLTGNDSVERKTHGNRGTTHRRADGRSERNWRARRLARRHAIYSGDMLNPSGAASVTIIVVSSPPRRSGT